MRGWGRPSPSRASSSPTPAALFQTALAATTLPTRDEIDPQKFLPSSRSVAFTKAAWSRAGGYPEWLDYCEDLLFDLRAQRAALQRADRLCLGTRAPPFTSSHAKAGANFGCSTTATPRGDGKADLWRKRHALRYAVYLVLIPALVGPRLAGASSRAGWAGRVCWRAALPTADSLGGA